MKDVSELFFLGAQIVEIVLVGFDLERHPLDDLDAVATDARALARVVREDPDLLNAEIGENLGADAVVAKVRAEAELMIRLDGIEALLILEFVGLDLVLEADAATFLPHVENDPGTRLRDHPHRGIELLAAIAAHRAESITGQTFAMHANQDRFVSGRSRPTRVPYGRRDRCRSRRRSLRIRRIWSASSRPPTDERAARSESVGDEVLDRDDLEVVLLAELDQVGQPRHRPVVLHDLADHAGRMQPASLARVDRAFGLADATKNAALARAQREDVTGTDDIRAASHRRSRPASRCAHDPRRRSPSSRLRGPRSRS